MNFVSDFKHPEEIKPDSLWFLIYEQKIIVFSEDKTTVIPEYKNLKEHNIVTVEPGLYDPKIGGVRLEDIIEVTKSGYSNLTKLETRLEI